MICKNRYQSTNNNSRQSGFIIKTIIIIAAIFGILAFFDYTPDVLYKEFVEPYKAKFDGAKGKADQFKADSEARDATYQEYLNDM